ncbi:MAG TPA: endo alpha-1,4 polygalactosaminidase [Gaiellaceae bacterium]|nr:endo alpha-1,4 polygalactosaminidase [Gaiellaceae bacterium]
MHTWAFAIGGPVSDARLARYDLVVLDGESTPAARVARLRGEGKLVLAYLDAGTIERGRGWFPRAKRYRLDYWPDWGEWYAEVSAPGYRALVGGVARSFLAKGFDGLFLDNVDMVETHPAQRAGMTALVRSLASLVHGRGGFLFAQNGEDAIGPLVRWLDGWNREDVTGTYDFAAKRYVAVPAADRAAALAALRRMRAKGLLALATDYLPAGRSTAAAVAAACRAGALPFVGDVELTRVPARPLRCP